MPPKGPDDELSFEGLFDETVDGNAPVESGPQIRTDEEQQVHRTLPYGAKDYEGGASQGVLGYPTKMQNKPTFTPGAFVEAVPGNLEETHPGAAAARMALYTAVSQRGKLPPADSLRNALLQVSAAPDLLPSSENPPLTLVEPIVTPMLPRPPEMRPTLRGVRMPTQPPSVAQPLALASTQRVQIPGDSRTPFAPTAKTDVISAALAEAPREARSDVPATRRPGVSEPPMQRADRISITPQVREIIRKAEANLPMKKTQNAVIGLKGEFGEEMGKMHLKAAAREKAQAEAEKKAFQEKQRRISLWRLVLGFAGIVVSTGTVLGISEYEKYVDSLTLNPTPSEPLSPEPLDVRIPHLEIEAPLELPKRFTIAQAENGVRGGLIGQVMNAFYHGATQEQINALHKLRDFIQADALAYDKAIAEGKNFDELIKNADAELGNLVSEPGLQYALIRQAFKRDRKDPNFKGKTGDIEMVYGGEMIHIDPDNNPLFKALFSIRNANQSDDDKKVTPADIEELSVLLAHKASIEKVSPNKDTPLLPIYDANSNWTKVVENTVDANDEIDVDVSEFAENQPAIGEHQIQGEHPAEQSADEVDYFASLKTDLAKIDRKTMAVSPLQVQTDTASAAAATLARLDALMDAPVDEDIYVDLTDFEQDTVMTGVEIDGDIGEGLHSAKDEAIIADALAELAASRAKRAANSEQAAIVEQSKPAAWSFATPDDVDALNDGWDV